MNVEERLQFSIAMALRECRRHFVTLAQKRDKDDVIQFVAGRVARYVIERSNVQMTPGPPAASASTPPPPSPERPPGT